MKKLLRLILLLYLQTYSSSMWFMETSSTGMVKGFPILCIISSALILILKLKISV